MQSIKGTYQRITDTVIEQQPAQSRGFGPGAETAAAPSCRAALQAKPIAGSTS